MKPICIEFPREEKEFGPHAVYQESVAETFPLHTHDFYEIFLVAGGKAIHEVNGASQLLSKGSLVYIRPEDVHCYKAFNYFDFKLFNVGYLPDDFLPILRYLEIPLSVITEPELPVHLEITGDEFEYLAAQLGKLAKLFPNRKCRTLFRSFVSAIYYPFVMDGNPSIRLQSQKIPQWMIQLDKQMSVRDNYIKGTKRIYELCNYSQPHIIRSFQKYFQMSPTEYVNSKRMNYVCELLLTQQHSVSEICYIAGFNNLSYFYNVFHKMYHCTPTEFLKRNV